MGERKVVNTEDINWYEEDENRLDYDIAFDGNGYQKKNKESAEEGLNQQVDVKKLIEKRNKKWEKRLQKAREQAFQKGRRQGQEEGYRKAQNEIDDKVSRLENLIQKAHSQWTERYQALNPGLLDLVFDIVEKIVGLPVENPKLREQLEEELSMLLHETENDIKPLLWVSKADYGFVEQIVEKHAPELSVSIRISENCNPGEFEYDTKNETVVHRFQEKVNDLKENLSLPSWK